MNSITSYNVKIKQSRKLDLNFYNHFIIDGNTSKNCHKKNSVKLFLHVKIKIQETYQNKALQGT